MATEGLFPNILLDQTNLSGSVTDIDDDERELDGLWLTAIDPAEDIVCRVGFPTPITTPPIGVDLQLFRIFVRRTDNSEHDPSLDVELYENGVFIDTILNNKTITSPIGEQLTGFWNANLLSDSSGAGVELRIVGTASGGPPGQRNTVEVGAIVWISGERSSEWFQAVGISNNTVQILIKYDLDLVQGYIPADEDTLDEFLPYFEVEALHFLNTGDETWYFTYYHQRGKEGQKFFDYTVTPGTDEILNIPEPQRPMSYEDEYTAIRIF